MKAYEKYDKQSVQSHLWTLSQYKIEKHTGFRVHGVFEHAVYKLQWTYAAQPLVPSTLGRAKLPSVCPAPSIHHRSKTEVLPSSSLDHSANTSSKVPRGGLPHSEEHQTVVATDGKVQELQTKRKLNGLQ